MRKPNLFLVGFPKAGTTTLSTMLSRHPDIFLPNVDEVHYFETQYKNLPYCGPGDMQSAPLKSESEYLRLYGQGTERYLLDYTPSYIEHPEVAGDIYSFNPDAKIFIMLRNPVKRCFSNYCHQVRKGCEDLTFELALEAEERRKLDNWGMFWRYKENSFYYQRTRAYFDGFERSNIKVITTDELRDRPETISQEVLEWLDLDWADISVSGRYNVSGRPNWKHVLLQRLASISAIKNIGRKIVSDEAIKRFKNNNVSKIDLDPSMEKKLSRLFKADIEKLESLVDKDLSNWYRETT